MRSLLLLFLACVARDGANGKARRETFNPPSNVLEFMELKLLSSPGNEQPKKENFVYDSTRQNSIYAYEPHFPLFKKWTQLFNSARSPLGRLETDTCYAPPFVYGPRCESSRGIVGSPGYMVTYTVSPAETSVEPQVCCEGRGYAGVVEIWINLGCGSDQSEIRGSVPWGANAGRPAISCTAMPTGSAVSWTFQ